MVNVVATITVIDGKTEEYSKHARIMVAETVKEKGCIMYEFCQSKDDPLKFAMIEKWESQEALEAHFGSAHFKEFVSSIEGLAIVKAVDQYSVL